VESLESRDLLSGTRLLPVPQMETSSDDGRSALLAQRTQSDHGDHAIRADRIDSAADTNRTAEDKHEHKKLDRLFARAHNETRRQEPADAEARRATEHEQGEDRDSIVSAGADDSHDRTRTNGGQVRQDDAQARPDPSENPPPVNTSRQDTDDSDPVTPSAGHPMQAVAGSAKHERKPEEKQAPGKPGRRMADEANASGTSSAASQSIPEATSLADAVFQASAEDTPASPLRVGGAAAGVDSGQVTAFEIGKTAAHSAGASAAALAAPEKQDGRTALALALPSGTAIHLPGRVLADLPGVALALSHPEIVLLSVNPRAPGAGNALDLAVWDDKALVSLRGTGTEIFLAANTLRNAPAPGALNGGPGAAPADQEAQPAPQEFELIDRVPPADPAPVRQALRDFLGRARDLLSSLATPQGALELAPWLAALGLGGLVVRFARRRKAAAARGTAAGPAADTDTWPPRPTPTDPT
jgi:hypothetical protein